MTRLRLAREAEQRKETYMTQRQQVGAQKQKQVRAVMNEVHVSMRGENTKANLGPSPPWCRKARLPHILVHP